MNVYLLSILINGAFTVYGFKPQLPVLNPESMEMYWVDGRDRRDSPVIIDTFFDRVVCISIHLSAEVIGQNQSRYFFNEVTGVFITRSLVLTSYNPFTIDVENVTLLENYRVKHISGRYFRSHIKDASRGSFSYYREDANVNTIACARKVTYPFDWYATPEDLKHGIHIPIHDLLVIRISKPVTFLNPVPKRLFSFKGFDKIGTIGPATIGNRTLVRGYSPIRTDVAIPGELLDEETLMFASIAHVNDHHIVENRFLEKGNVSTPDNSSILADCDEFIPRKWGHFICLKNVHNYEGIASGAVLFSKGKLFGVGSFAVFREENRASGVLVFTDVRPYAHLLNKTCTKKDQNV